MTLVLKDREGRSLVRLKGQGASVTLRLPLNLAIIDGLLVRGEKPYDAVTLTNTLECIELTRQNIEKANGELVSNVRGEIIPYIRLRDFFDVQTERPEREQIMIAETEERRYGFVADEALGDHQTAIKNLGRFCRQVQFISDSAILGKGSVALILGPHRLLKEAIGRTLRGPRVHPNSAAAKSRGKEGLALISP